MLNCAHWRIVLYAATSHRRQPWRLAADHATAKACRAHVRFRAYKGLKSGIAPSPVYARTGSFDSQTGEYVNLTAKDIIDPTKVVRVALQNAPEEEPRRRRHASGWGMGSMDFSF